MSTEQVPQHSAEVETNSMPHVDVDLTIEEDPDGILCLSSDDEEVVDITHQFHRQSMTPTKAVYQGYATLNPSSTISAPNQNPSSKGVTTGLGRSSLIQKRSSEVSKYCFDQQRLAYRQRNISKPAKKSKHDKTPGVPIRGKGPFLEDDDDDDDNKVVEEGKSLPALPTTAIFASQRPPEQRPIGRKLSKINEQFRRPRPDMKKDVKLPTRSTPALAQSNIVRGDPAKTNGQGETGTQRHKTAHSNESPRIGEAFQRPTAGPIAMSISSPAVTGPKSPEEQIPPIPEHHKLEKPHNSQRQPRSDVAEDLSSKAEGSFGPNEINNQTSSCSSMQEAEESQGGRDARPMAADHPKQQSGQNHTGPIIKETSQARENIDLEQHASREANLPEGDGPRISEGKKRRSVTPPQNESLDDQRSSTASANIYTSKPRPPISDKPVRKTADVCRICGAMFRYPGNLELHRLSCRDQGLGRLQDMPQALSDQKVKKTKLPLFGCGLCKYTASDSHCMKRHFDSCERKRGNPKGLVWNSRQLREMRGNRAALKKECLEDQRHLHPFPAICRAAHNDSNLISPIKRDESASKGSRKRALNEIPLGTLFDPRQVVSRAETERIWAAKRRKLEHSQKIPSELTDYAIEDHCILSNQAQRRQLDCQNTKSSATQSLASKAHDHTGLAQWQMICKSASSSLQDSTDLPISIRSSETSVASDAEDLFFPTKPVKAKSPRKTQVYAQEPHQAFHQSSTENLTSQHLPLSPTSIVDDGQSLGQRSHHNERKGPAEPHIPPCLRRSPVTNASNTSPFAHDLERDVFETPSDEVDIESYICTHKPDVVAKTIRSPPDDPSREDLSLASSTPVPSAESIEEEESVDCYYVYYVEVKRWGSGLAEKMAITNRCGPFHTTDEANRVAQEEVNASLTHPTALIDRDDKRPDKTFDFSFTQDKSGMHTHRLTFDGMYVETAVRRERNIKNKRRSFPKSLFKIPRKVYLAQTLVCWTMNEAEDADIDDLFEDKEDTSKKPYSADQIPEYNTSTLDTCTTIDLANTTAAKHYTHLVLDDLTCKGAGALTRQETKSSIEREVREMNEDGAEELFRKTIDIDYGEWTGRHFVFVVEQEVHGPRNG